jgi:hypothetical protein
MADEQLQRGNGDCVQVACPVPNAVAVRDSKDPGGPGLTFAAGPWEAFTGAVKQRAAGLVGSR